MKITANITGHGLVQIEIQHGRIAAVRTIGPEDSSQPHICPGFVDLQINGFAGVSGPQNTLCCTWGAKPPFSRRFPSMLLTPQVFPQLPNWPTFGAFFVSPFVSAFAMAGQMRAPAAVAGGRFSPSPPGNQECVNGWPNMSSLRPDEPNPRGVYS